jgi:hypothetical protein
VRILTQFQRNVHFFDAPSHRTFNIQRVPEIDDETEIQSSHSSFIAARLTGLLWPDGAQLSFKDILPPLKCVLVGHFCDHVLESGSRDLANCPARMEDLRKRIASMVCRHYRASIDSGLRSKNIKVSKSCMRTTTV